MSKSNTEKQEPDRSGLRAQLEAASCADACFSFSALPYPTFVGGANDIGAGFGWCPLGLPVGNSVHLTSSRLSRQPEEFPTWFDALRTFACTVDASGAFLLTSEGTTTDRWSVRIGELFAIPVVTVKRFPKRVTQSWIEQQQAMSSECIRTIWIELSADVVTDDLLVSIASEVRVLRVRSGGNVYRAVTRRLETSVGRTWMLVDPSLTRPSESEKMIQAGATGWWLYPAANQDGALLDQAAVTPVNRSALLALEDVDSSTYAIHWTRRRDGAWPDQSDPAYLDDLIFRRDASDHHALSSLRRILMTQRLIASNDLTRSETPVVCFADVRLSDVKERRTFRSHLARWDFEPYGVAIRKETLKRLGARAVIYGDDDAWNGLAETDRPYFQLATSRDGKHDWRSEHEIRLRGDLLLRKLGPDEAVVFVSSTEEAELIAPLSRWPVVVLNN